MAEAGDGAAARTDTAGNGDARTEAGVQALLFLAFCLLYLATLCRTTYLGDAGEISAAIATGGIVHPPGYPLFSLLGRLCILVIPFGEPAFRIGCLVAIAGAGAVLALYRFCRGVGVGRFCALAGAATFGTSFLFWSQCVRVEVYSLHALLYGFALGAAWRYGQTGSRRALYLAALAFSLGLAHHLTMLFLLPALLILAGPRLWTDPKPVARVGSVILVILAVGPPLYLLLMAWAKADPILDWSRPITWDALYAHVSAQEYRHYLGPPTLPKLAEHVGEAVRSLGDTLLWVGIPAALAGAVLLWKDPTQPGWVPPWGRVPGSQRRAAAGLFVGIAVITTYNQFYQIGDILVYYLPVWWMATVLLAVGLQAGFDLLRRKEISLVAAYACCLALPGIQLARNYAACNLSGVTFVREFARQKLQDCAPNGVLMVQDDDDVYPVNYVHFALKERPDVLVMDMNALHVAYSPRSADKSAWYLYSLRREGVDVATDIPRDAQGHSLLNPADAKIALLSRLAVTRPLHTTYLDDRTPEQRAQDAATGTRTVSALIQWINDTFVPLPQGVVIRLWEKNRPVVLKDLLATNKQLWDNIALPDMSALRTDAELDTSYVTDHYATMLVSYGHLYEMDNSPNDAAAIYTIAQRLAPHNPDVERVWAEFQKKYRATPAPPGTP